MLHSSSTHGYTGHEMAESVGVIHMNGRIYDPVLARFLQADPFVQAPGDGQNWNRYSYVFNNPLVHTDPSGYWGRSEQMWLRTIAAIVITVYTGGAAAGAWSFLGTSVTTTAGAYAVVAVGGFAAGAVQTGTLRGAATGAVSAAAFYGIGDYFQGASWAHDADGSLSMSGYAAKTLAHGVAGGVMSELQGGNFGHGFASAGFGEAVSPVTANIHSTGGQVVAAAVVGGTASELGGGKFANGAVTAAFSFAFGSIAARGGSSGGDHGVTVTGCGSRYGCTPGFWDAPEYLQPETNADLDNAAIMALQGARPRPGGEWTGYIEYSYPQGAYVASAPQFLAYNQTSHGLAVDFGIPTDAVAIYHTHPLFPTQSANVIQMQFGPGDAGVLYSRGIPNYLRPPIGPMSVLEMTNMGPMPRQITPNTTKWGW